MDDVAIMFRNLGFEPNDNDPTLATESPET
jgi:hypothetical protein